MANLQVTEAKAEKLGELEDLSLRKIKEALEGKIASDSEEIKISVKVLGIVAKNRQTLTNRSAIEFGMASYLGSEEQLKKYIAATNPQIQKALN